jgi:hypothetical protein
MRGSPSLRRVKVRWFALVGVTLGLMGCGEATAIEGTARDAAVVEQVVRATVRLDTDEPVVAPVVYAVGVEGTIPIEVQAAVAAALVDDYDLRFADERAEAIDAGTEDEAVRDGGVLLVIGNVPSQGRSIDVEVERYESLRDVERLAVSLRWRDPTWVVTATEPVELG